MKAGSDEPDGPTGPMRPFMRRDHRRRGVRGRKPPGK